MNIHKENIEELILLLVDRELSEPQAAAVLDFIEKNPEHQLLLQEYRSLVSEPDTTIIFENKASLKKPVKLVMQPHTRRRWHPAGVAAGILLIAAGGWLLSPKAGNIILPESPEVVKQTTHPVISDNLPRDTAITMPRVTTMQAEEVKVNTPKAVVHLNKIKLQQTGPLPHEDTLQQIVQQPVPDHLEPPQEEIMRTPGPLITPEPKQEPIAQQHNKQDEQNVPERNYPKGVLGNMIAVADRLSKPGKKELVVAVGFKQKKEYTIAFNF